jgi:mutator protein MutT
MSMTTVTAAIIEKNGLILAARRKPGIHMAGHWEFPGGKLEPEETVEECLARELREEFGIECSIGSFLAESVYDYGTKVIRLLGYRVRHLSGTFQCRDHDRLVWLPVDELDSLTWAPADIPLVRRLQEEYRLEATLAYYRDNAREYIRETIDLDAHHHIRQRFLDLLPINSLILDLGCGSGRDSRYFVDRGHRIMAVDAVEEMAEQAARHLGQPVRVARAEDLDEVAAYDAIWACAVLVHLPRSRIEAAIKRIVRALKPDGICYMSFKKGETEYQDHKGRFFADYSPPRMEQLLARFPELKRLDLSESSSVLWGQHQQWLNVLVKKVAITLG